MCENVALCIWMCQNVPLRHKWQDQDVFRHLPALDCRLELDDEPRVFDSGEGVQQGIHSLRRHRSGVEDETHGHQHDSSRRRVRHPVVQLWRQRRRLWRDLQPAHVDEGLRQQPGVVEHVVGVDQDAAQVAKKCLRGRRGGQMAVDGAVAHVRVVVHQSAGKNFIQEVEQAILERHLVRILRQEHLKRKKINCYEYAMDEQQQQMTYWHMRRRRGCRGHFRLPAAEGEGPVSDGRQRQLPRQGQAALVEDQVDDGHSGTGGPQPLPELLVTQKVFAVSLDDGPRIARQLDQRGERQSVRPQQLHGHHERGLGLRRQVGQRAVPVVNVQQDLGVVAAQWLQAEVVLVSESV